MTNAKLLAPLLVGSAVAACGGAESTTAPSPPPSTPSLRVEVSTTGEMPDPDGFSVLVDGQPRSIAANGSVTFSDLPAGQVEVSLAGLEFNCQVVGDAVVQERIEIGRTALTRFVVHCVRPLDDRLVFYRSANGTSSIYSAALVPDARGVLTDQRRLIQGGVEPDVSPDGTRILWTGFDAGGVEKIFVSAADGSNPVLLTDHPSRNLTARWSPDGSRIAFLSDRDGKDAVFLMNADGTGLQRVTDPRSHAGPPVWAPDGRSVAFTSDREDRGPVTAPSASVAASGGRVAAAPRYVYTLAFGPCFRAGGCAVRRSERVADGLHVAWNPFRPNFLAVRVRDVDGERRLSTLQLSDGSVQPIPVFRGWSGMRQPAFGSRGELAADSRDPDFGILVALNPDDPNAPVWRTGGDDSHPSWGPR